MAVTPMLEQYLSIKKDNPGAILFFRLGDFYEMFNDDALIGSKELELTLTSRDAGKDNRVPMCGVPYHAASSYIGRLVEKGYKVAICEQVEDPREAKGLVKREVVRVVTPGTFAEGSAFEGQNGYIACIYVGKEAYGFAFADISTGEFFTTQIEGANCAGILADELYRITPLEIITAPRQTAWLKESGIFDRLPGIYRDETAERFFQYDNARNELLKQFGVVSLEGFGCSEWPLAITASGALLSYLRETQKHAIPQILKLSSYQTSKYMYLDSSTRRNLELTRTLREGDYQGSLLWVLDATVTPMGRRLIRKWVEQPLINQAEICKRHAAVEALATDNQARGDLRMALDGVYDLERLAGRIAAASANARDLNALQLTLSRLPSVISILGGFNSATLSAICQRINPLVEVVSAITQAIVEDPPVAIKEGGLIKPGFSKALDELRTVAVGAKEWLGTFEAAEKERTGIKSLKVGFNQVFGYYIEVTNPNLHLVPADYTRKQTLANCERFVTSDLKKYEDIILGSDEKGALLEYELFVKLRETISGFTSIMQENAQALAEMDVLSAFAETAVRNNYVRPELVTGGELFYKDGRHPVVEKMSDAGSFVANDLYLDLKDNRIMIVTGPNMAGKSTFLRQTALIVLLSQIGSFVPASYARLAIVDRIFTRVGASDDLATGQSTFMVEMNELANILNHAGKNSLLILDEIGRGTSTYDGLSIAWAVIEYLQDPENIGAKTLFATHYHELTELEGRLPGIKNVQVSVSKHGEDIVFLRKIVPGGADRSYGIEVARLAGLPAAVLERAREILVDLERTAADELSMVVRNTGTSVASAVAAASENAKPVQQLALFQPTPEPLAAELARLDLSRLTPLEALTLLHEWQHRYSKLNSEPNSKSNSEATASNKVAAAATSQKIAEVAATSEGEERNG